MNDYKSLKGEERRKIMIISKGEKKTVQYIHTYYCKNGEVGKEEVICKEVDDKRLDRLMKSFNNDGFVFLCKCGDWHNTEEKECE